MWGCETRKFGITRVIKKGHKIKGNKIIKLSDISSVSASSLALSFGMGTWYFNESQCWY